MCHYADIYNANRLKEYCAWFHRTHPQVDSQIEESQFSFLDKQSKTASQAVGNGNESYSMSDSIL